MTNANFKLRPNSGLNLNLSGTVGSFGIKKAGSDQSPLEVIYLATHVSLDETGPNPDLLKQLTPVREIFEYKSLGFEEMMQRDIDDARVSRDLVPYLLDASISNTIKFFPPIVVVVLPVLEDKPATKYPMVTKECTEREGTTYQLIRSGSVGQEAFQFEHPLVDGIPFLHDQAKLKLNTNKIKLVIIDGQHRAMALLAIYRNLKSEWSDARRAPFKSYYGKWTKKAISQFDLTKVQLPVIICTVPGLDDSYQGDFDVVRAARSMFLTLNKTARQVSNSRNKLLDDRDLVSFVLRDTLGRIKQRDHIDPTSMRIWNVELDQYRDQVKIDAATACTGVSHVYYILEHIMFDENDVVGVKARSGKFYKRSNVTNSLLRRIDGENLLGSDVAGSLKRDSFSTVTAKTISDKFFDSYLCFYLQCFDDFGPLKAHNNAALAIYENLKTHANPQVLSILYEGQNIGRTFEEYLKDMREEKRALSDGGGVLPPEVSAHLKELEVTETQVTEARSNLRLKRAEEFLGSIPDRSKLQINGCYTQLILGVVKRLFEDVFTSVAFQAALACGFFLVMEKAEKQALEDSEGTIDRKNEFDSYMKNLNAFFAPTSIKLLKNLIQVLSFDVTNGSPVDWEKVPSDSTFSAVVHPGEMKPDEWPKYRYMLLELWNPLNPQVSAARNQECDICRAQVFNSLLAGNIKKACIECNIPESDLTSDQREKATKRTYEALKKFQEGLGVKTSCQWNIDRYKINPLSLSGDESVEESQDIIGAES